MAIVAPTPIYCDEAGFTGNNLLSPEQPLFVYASVMVDGAEAERIVQQMRADFRLQSQEPKGKDLMRSPQGRRAVRFVIDSLGENIKFFIFDKRLALACKFFEHVYEPVLAANNLLFYRIGFHKFIANLLCMEQMVNEEIAETFRSLERLARARDSERDASAAARLFDNSRDTPWLRSIGDFCRGYTDIIAQEFGTLSKWILELSGTALYTLACAWGERYSSLEIIADRSKPLEAETHIMDALVGHPQRHLMDFGDGAPTLISPNLLRPVRFLESKDVAGIQLADLIASSIAYAYPRRDEEELNQFILSMVPYCVRCVFPDFEAHLDLSRQGPVLNSIVMEELGRRGREGIDPLVGMPEFVAAAYLSTRSLPS